MNYVDFLKDKQDVSFDELALTELDFAIFSEIVYLPLDSVMADRNNLLFKDVAIMFLDHYESMTNINAYLCAPHRIEIMKVVKDSKRYEAIELMYFSDYVDAQSNFTALTFQLNSQERVVAYRGTTDSIIGWRENFNLAIGKNMPSQVLAYNYLLKQIDEGTYRYYLTGHSKGANLSVYAALQLEVPQAEKIQGLYIFDGPGFESLKEYTNHPIITDKKIHHYIANFSIVGLILNHSSLPIVVNCKSMSLLHHLTNLWQVEGSQFTRRKEMSASSQLFHYVSTEWIKVTTVSDRKKYINDLFDIVLDSGIQSFNELNDKPIDFARKILKQYRQLDQDTIDFIKGQNDIIVKIANDYYRDHTDAIKQEHKHLINLISVYKTLSQNLLSPPSLSNIVKKLSE